ncbi:MAG: LysR family transcriptional regulator [Paracoccaceae bacterium]
MSVPPPRLRLRLVFAPGVMLGPGKADLLAAIADTGSIAGAGRAMKMSYKRAWGLVEAMNAIFDAPLVDSVRGGAGHGGAMLTPLGREVLGRYRAMVAAAEAGAAEDIAALVARRNPTPPA